MKAGDIAYLVESNRVIREVHLARCTGGLYLVKFTDTGGGIQVKKHRLFETKEAAEESIGIKKEPNRYVHPDYWDGTGR